MHKLKNIWRELYQNFDTYLTIVIAVIIAILGVSNAVDETILSAAVLATLALVAISNLRNRKADDEIQSLIKGLKERTIPSEEFFEIEYFKTHERLLDALPRADTVIFWGLVFERTLPVLREKIQEGLLNGLTVRFLLAKPNSNSVKMAALRDHYRDESAINLILHKNLLHLTRLAAEKGFSGKLEVKVIDYLPPWTLVAVNQNRADGIIFTYLAPFRVPKAERPAFQLSASKDKKWFGFFVDQFEKAWQVAQEVEFEQTNPSQGI